MISNVARALVDHPKTLAGDPIPCRLLAALAIGSSLLMIAPTKAYPIPLSNLLDANGSIIQGDKLFSNFATDPANNFVLGGASPSSVFEIDIEGITISGQNGLRFTGPFSTTVLDDRQSFGQFNIQFDVTVLDPAFLISDIHHSFAATVDGACPFCVVNTRAGGAPSFVPFAQITSDFFSSGVFDESANLTDALAGIDVAVPSIRMFEFFQFGFLPETSVPTSVQVSPIDVTFSQVAAVPEPATMALFGIGLLGLGAMSLRRKDSLAMSRSWRGEAPGGSQRASPPRRPDY